MKTKFILIVCALLLSEVIYAQEYKIAKSTGRLDIREVNNVTIEGTTGNEILFVRTDRNQEDDDRAKGLRAVSSTGLEDNTGLGLSVLDKAGVIEVRQLKKMDGPEITIKVPKGVTVYFAHNSPHGSEVEFRNFEGEIEVSTVHNAVILTNSSGPMNIKTIHGDIDASFSPGIKNISLTSVHGHVDVALPVATKASLKLGTVYGEIFVDPDFKIEIERAGDMIKYSDNVTGKINGGGTEINLSSTHNNVYLRKK
jgi:hypothetical protein